VPRPRTAHRAPTAYAGPDDERLIRRRFLLLTALRWFPGGLVLPVLVLLMQARALTLSEIGTLFAGFAILTAACELPTGGLADVFGHKPILLASSILTIAAFVMFATSQDFAGFAVAFAIFAVGRALSSGPLRSWYVDSVNDIQPPPDIRPALSREGLISSLSIGSAAVLGGVIPELIQRIFPNLPAGGSSLLIALSVPIWLAAGLLSVATVAIAVLMTSRQFRPAAKTTLIDKPP